MLHGSDVYLLLFLDLSTSSLQIIAKGFALLKFYRQCVRWLQAARILSLNLSAAVMEAGAGVTSVSSVHFPEPPNIRNSVHMDQAILQMEEVFAGMKRGRKGEMDMLIYLKKCRILFEVPSKNFLQNNSLIFQMLPTDQKLKTHLNSSCNQNTHSCAEFSGLGSKTAGTKQKLKARNDPKTFVC